MSKTANHTPGLALNVLESIVELRRRWRSQDQAETIDSIDYMDGLDALDLDGAVADAAAAPALLAACRELVAEHDARGNECGPPHDTGGIVLARAAIALAEGGAA